MRLTHLRTMTSDHRHHARDDGLDVEEELLPFPDLNDAEVVAEPLVIADGLLCDASGEPLSVGTVDADADDGSVADRMMSEHELLS